MKTLIVNSAPNVEAIFNSYPAAVRDKLEILRKIILETASTLEDVIKVEESLKWGEPSYRSNIGSTIRINWNPKHPNQYSMFFQCSTSLVETFRVVFSDVFRSLGRYAFGLWSLVFGLWLFC